MKKLFIRVILLIVLTGYSREQYAQTVNNREQHEKRPNILIFLVDDMGFSDIGCYGGEIKTPNLDNLAKESLRFSRFYNTAKCFPSRACLLTGQYAQNTGMDENPASFINAVSIAEVLRNAGYRTLMTGKHHGEENPVYFGFDRYFGLKDGCCNYFNPGIQRPGEPIPANKRGTKETRNWAIDSLSIFPYTPEEKDFYTTDYFTNYAIKYLEEYKNDNKPFFLYVAFNAPHDPLMAWPEDIKKYYGKYMAGYETIRQKRYEKQKEMGLIKKNFPLSPPTYENWDSLSYNEKLERDSIMSTYAAMIDRVDQNIGRIFTKLKDLGEMDNTVILFMSDNGAQNDSETNSWLYGKKYTSDLKYPIGSVGRYNRLNTSWANVSNTPFRYYKSNSHEGGISTPLIFYWKGKIVNRGGITDYPSHFIDIMPTILDITGAEYPSFFNNEKINPVNGVSLLPLLTKGINPDRQNPIFWKWSQGKAIRKENWKLVSDNNGPWELYNIGIDQTETNNLIKKFPAVAEELIKEWETWDNINKSLNK
ncbi:MAG: sulfatase-like hydrolase/transferase [Bacteroidia bacterium]|nr:sulfatase-like hydrolase/transferase [Bacteroidia bacterium]